MKVAVISKSGRGGGGASKVAEDLAVWLNDAGHKSDHFIAFSDENGTSYQHSLYGNSSNVNLAIKIHQITSRLGFREILPVEYWFNLKQVIHNYDVIHFHDLFTAISPISLALVARHKPTFFTVHDCSAFTGGCLYPMGCEKFVTHCNQCPQLGASTWKQKIRDRTREIQSIKRYIAKRFDINYIFPSHWIAQQANLAMEFKRPPLVIPNGINLSPFTFDFTFENKSEAKKSLKIDEHRQVVLVSALSLNDFRKGANYAVAALQSVIDLNPIVMTVGKPNQALKQVLQGLDVIEMGFVSDPNFMAKICLASDIMLFCSLADNLPLTVLEAMAAATVIVGFATGGVPDMIKSGLNGILVECQNQEALNQALRQTMLSEHLQNIGQQARLDVENNFSKSIFLDRHLQIYQKVLNNYEI